MAFRSKWQALPTEAINPATLGIDKLSAGEIVELMLSEDRKMIAAVQREKDRIALGADLIAASLRQGGRIFFVGAGTSGRLGVLESAEMPPTFGTDPTLVQAVIAGGRGATFRAKEGIEDNYEEGARAVTRVRPGRKDVVIGVSASGMTPFVRGALTRARKAGSKVMFVTCDPRSELQTFVDLTIALAVGPEVIAGSTRLKAGTATKMVLNMLTTTAMIRIGKTYGNLMVDVRTGSEKLKDRARRIVNIVTGLEYDDADRLLARARWNVKAAVVMQKAGLDVPEGAEPAPQSQRTRPRGARRGHRTASSRHDRVGAAAQSERAAASGPAEIPRGGLVQHDLHPRMQLQERRRQHRRQRPLDHPPHARGLPLARGDEHETPGLQNRRHAHRQRLAGHEIDFSPEEGGIRSARLGTKLHAVRARLEVRSRAR